MSKSPESSARPRRRATSLIVAAGLVGAVAMALASTNTLSAFVATVVNSNNTAATGSVVLRETSDNGSTSCSSTDVNTVSSNYATCATINKFGGSTTMVPSDPEGRTNAVTTTVRFQNTGVSEANSFSLGVGECTQSANGSRNGSATDLCSKLVGTISSGNVFLGRVTLAQAANYTFSLPPELIPAARGASTVPFTFRIHLDSSADNTYQGLSASQPITWTLSS